MRLQNLPLCLQRCCATISLYLSGYGAARPGAVWLVSGGGAEGPGRPGAGAGDGGEEPVAAVRSLPKGTPVSYGRTAVLERDSRIAVVPVGYGDGYPRSLSNRMVMRVRGVECPIVGRVCMDMCMLDVTGVPGVQAGDVAVVYDGPLLERAARLAGTIPYELMCDVNPRVPRSISRRTGRRRERRTRAT